MKETNPLLRERRKIQIKGVVIYEDDLVQVSWRDFANPQRTLTHTTTIRHWDESGDFRSIGILNKNGKPIALLENEIVSIVRKFN